MKPFKDQTDEELRERLRRLDDAWGAEPMPWGVRRDFDRIADELESRQPRKEESTGQDQPAEEAHGPES